MMLQYEIGKIVSSNNPFNTERDITNGRKGYLDKTKYDKRPINKRDISYPK